MSQRVCVYWWIEGRSQLNGGLYNLNLRLSGANNVNKSFQNFRNVIHSECKLNYIHVILLNTIQRGSVIACVYGHLSTSLLIKIMNRYGKEANSLIIQFPRRHLIEMWFERVIFIVALTKTFKNISPSFHTEFLLKS